MYTAATADSKQTIKHYIKNQGKERIHLKTVIDDEE